MKLGIVGLPHAPLMTKLGLCLEEYIDFLRQYPREGEHLYTEWDGQAYEVYFCQAETMYVPDGSSYTLSGNNVDGFIVSVRS